MMNARIRATLATTLLAASMSACTWDSAAPESQDGVPEAEGVAAESVPPLEPAQSAEPAEPAQPATTYAEVAAPLPDNPIDPANAGPTALPYAEGSRPARYPPAPDAVLAAETEASAQAAIERAGLGPAMDQPKDAAAQDAAALEYVEPQFDEETGRYH